MVNVNRPINNRKWSRLSQHRCLFFILLLGSLVPFLFKNIKNIYPEWNSSKRLKHSMELFIQFMKQNIVSGETNRSDESTAAAATVWFTATPTSAVHQTSEVIQQEVHQQAAWPTPVPYVSPGPYLVEYPYEYHFMINEPQRCEQEKPFVVLIVPVAPRNRAHRDVIRSTWGNENLVLDKVVKLFFLLGMQTGHDAQQVHEQLLQESNEHRDLIQSDFVDCYKNLTIKTMVMLEWLNSYCSGASYAMKIDSDMFLNVPNLVKMLLNAPETNYMTGLVAYDGEVLRNPSSKWYLPHEVFPPAVYPPYALGLGYILSLDLTIKLIEASRHVQAVYIEDVYLGLCMKHLGIAHTDPPEKHYFNRFSPKYHPCVIVCGWGKTLKQRASTADQ